MLRREKLLGFDAECLLVKGINLGNIPWLPEPKILFVQPCASVEGRVNCELRFGLPGKGLVEVFYDFPILSRVLNAYSDKLAEVRVSSDLGVARMRWLGKRVLVFKNGRMVIREAIDEEDAKSAIEFLSRLLAPSIICDKCGQVLLNCAIASCVECITQQVLSPMTINHPWAEVQGAENIIRASLEKVMRGEAVAFDSLSKQVDGIVSSSLDLIVDSKNREELVVGILLLRQVWDLSLILRLLYQIQRTDDRESKIMFIQSMLELWLLALKESLDGIADEKAHKSSINRWTEVSEAWSSLRREAENNPKLEALLSNLAERWPE